MKKAIMISVRPEWVEKILKREKVLELRKTVPNLELPFKGYIYCTSVKRMNLLDYWQILQRTDGLIDEWQGKVMAEFTCDRIIPIDLSDNLVDAEICELAAIDAEKVLKYAGTQKELYGLHISELRELSEPCKFSSFKAFNRKCIFGDLGYAIPECKKCSYCNLRKAPQSWCYVEEK